jgi:DNA mismatch repair protein MutL
MSDIVSVPRIHKLSVAVANQIAAGEVIERPASVVKELIENSIDAAATQIHIDLEAAGVSLIRVRDNGQGIHKDDLKLALQAHATSKLSAFSDLSQIVSMGFRGEAIPSIASVSRFKMTSRLDGTEQAWCIDNKNLIKPAAHEVGTTVEVNDLFYSTPGRRKFLKSEKTEYLHIQALIRALSLSHFSTGIFVKHNDHSLFSLPACKDNIEQRVHSVCGRSFLNNSVRVDSKKEGLHLWGWLGLSEVARSQSDRQYFYVNGRIVHDKHVNHALRLAYDDRIAIGRYPSYVLHLELDPCMVDVNVHPAKSEVRFSETRNIHDFIYSSLLSYLNKPVISVESDVRYADDNTHVQHNISETVNVYRASEFKQSDILDRNKLSVKYLTLLSDQFIVARVNNDSYLIDIAKARIVITAESLLQHYFSNSITKRPILVPVACELSQTKLQFLIKQNIKIQRWGFELEQITPDQVLIRAIPIQLIYSESISLLNDFLEALMKNNSDEFIARKLAQHVNDSGTALDDKSLEQLVNDILIFENGVCELPTLPWRKLDIDSLSTLLKK